VPPIVYLYWNWLQGLVEKRSCWGGALLWLGPVFALLVLMVLIVPKYSVVVYVLGFAMMPFVFPLFFIHFVYWRDKS
jgi:hypothetical protein